MSEGSNSIADDILRNGFERWQRLEGEKQAISDDLKELFAELKGQGFDGKALRASFRVVAMSGDVAVEEHNALVDLYVGSLMAPHSKETGTDRATRSRAAREADEDDRADALAALRADPALSIVEPANLKKSEPQPTKAAGQAAVAMSDSSEKASPSSAESEASGSGTVAAASAQITEPQPPQPAGSDLAVNPEPAGQVATNSEPAREGGSQSQEAAGPGRDGAAPSSGEAQPKYAGPGEIVWETHPPEGVERSAISTAFGTMGQDAAVIADDLEKGRAQPIVKKGKVILDGWARYMAARNMRELDGSPMAYPVVQYAGKDLLTDIIKLNVEGRMLTEQQKRLIAANLARQEPSRKEDIYRAFELFLEPV